MRKGPKNVSFRLFLLLVKQTTGKVDQKLYIGKSGSCKAKKDTQNLQLAVKQAAMPKKLSSSSISFSGKSKGKENVK